MVMGGDSSPEDRRFKSQHCVLDGHFSHLFVLKCLFEKTKMNEKMPGMANLKKRFEAHNYCTDEAINTGAV